MADGADDETTSAGTFRGPDAPVTSYMTSEVQHVEATATLRDVARMLVDAGIGCVAVGPPEAVVAVISERDIVRAVAGGTDLDSVTAAEAGSRELVWASSDDTIGDVAEEMMEDYVRHLLVRDDTGLVGILSMRDVLSAYVV
jgi:CBS domain-containing protein